MNTEYSVYFRRANGKLGQIDVPIEDGTNLPHQEAILQVKEHLVQSGEGYSGAVLSLIPSVPKVDLPLVAVLSLIPSVPKVDLPLVA